MVWNLQHQREFSKNGMRPAGTVLAAFLYKNCKAGESKEVILRREDFDKDTIKIKGQAYHRTYFGKTVSHVEDESHGKVTVLEKYSSSCYKMLVRPISFSLENERTKREPVLAENAGNAMFSKEHKKRLFEQQQQDISVIDQLLRSVGMVYSKSSLQKIWRMAGKSAGNSIEYVKEAIKYMLHSNDQKEEPIRKAHGWLMKCLRDGWHVCDESIFGGLGLPTYESGLLLLAKTVDTVFYESDGSIPIPIPSQ